MSCICGRGHANNLSCKTYMTPLTISELVDLIAKQGYKADVSEDSGTGIVRIVTSEALPMYVRQAIEASLPVGVKASFSTNIKTKMKLPESLRKWADQTQKYLK